MWLYCDYSSRKMSGYMILSFNQGTQFCSALSSEVTIKLHWASKFWMQENMFLKTTLKVIIIYYISVKGMSETYSRIFLICAST